MCFISSMPWVTCGQEKGVPAKEIYLKQSYRFYLFDKPWNFCVKHVIYHIMLWYELSINKIGFSLQKQNNAFWPWIVFERKSYILHSIEYDFHHCTKPYISFAKASDNLRFNDNINMHKYRHMYQPRAG